jgi:glycosyltransferase involved in cell wall biosynthesis
MKKYLVSAIVPAYNEEKKISYVLKPLSDSLTISEIIVINDGSTDNTLSIIKKFNNCILINLKINHGKGYAIAKGIKKAKGDIVIFTDADLIGFNEKHIKEFIDPLLTEKYSIVIGYPNYISADKLFRPLSGERAYWKKDLLPYVEEFEKKGYGLELYLNYLFKDKHIKLFPLHGVKHVLKHEKQKYDTIAKLLLVEGFDILSEILKQDNPFSYLMKSYLYSFYIQKPKYKNNQAEKLIQYIKKNLINKIIK